LSYTTCSTTETTETTDTDDGLFTDSADSDSESKPDVASDHWDSDSDSSDADSDNSSACVIA
jgi:hypothetical protein